MPLTPSEIEEIAALARRPGSCLDALGVVQRGHRWVSDEDVAEVARLLGMTADEVDAVATFYNLIFRRPVGRHVILACDSVSCWIMGAESLRRRLEARLGIRMGETTADGRFTLLPIVCLGACDHAPALMVDDDLHGDLDAGGLERVLEAYR